MSGYQMKHLPSCALLEERAYKETRAVCTCGYQARLKAIGDVVQVARTQGMSKEDLSEEILRTWDAQVSFTRGLAECLESPDQPAGDE
jgi:hypothetical protein